MILRIGVNYGAGSVEGRRKKKKKINGADLLTLISRADAASTSSHTSHRFFTFFFAPLNFRLTVLISRQRVFSRSADSR